MRLRRYLVASLLLAVVACGGRPAPRTTPSVTPPPAADAPRSAVVTASAVEALRGELETLFHPAGINALWGVVIQSFDTGEMLYEQNADLLLVPASNMKLLTMTAAAGRLGWEYRFETRLETRGDVVDGTLRGDLVVVGGGDPTLGGPLEDAAPVFAVWAEALKAAGIRRIDGRIVGDEGAITGLGLGDGWAWDDLTYGYSTPASGLSFHENVVDVKVRPGASDGDQGSVELSPEGSGLTVTNLVRTVAAGGEPDVDVWRPLGSSTLEVRGRIAVGTEPLTRLAAVPDPALFFASALRAALIARGLEVTGPAVAERGTACGSARVVATHRSKPLGEIGTRFMKVSQNLYGELLLRALGATKRGDGGSAPPLLDDVQAGRQVVEDTFTRWGVPPGQYRVVDGSGLSRRNFVTPRTLVRLLRQMARDPQHAERFAATLPVAGQDGTLSSRMKGTKAAGNVRAKTGSLMSVRALSGYVRTQDGELLGFSILANNFIAPPASIDGLIDLAVERLANFTRQ